MAVFKILKGSFDPQHFVGTFYSSADGGQGNLLVSVDADSDIHGQTHVTVRFGNDPAARYGLVKDGEDFFCNEYQLNKRRSNANQLRWVLTNQKQHHSGWPKTVIWTRTVALEGVKSPQDDVKTGLATLVQTFQAKSAAASADREKSPKKAKAADKITGLVTKVPEGVLGKVTTIGETLLAKATKPDKE